MGSRVKKKTIIDVILSSQTDNIDFIVKTCYKPSGIENVMTKLKVE